MFCAYRFGMELYAGAGVLCMRKGHHCAVGGMCCGFQRGVFKAFYCQGVIPHYCEWRGDAFEQRAAVVRHFACFAVHGIGRVYELRAEVHAERLVAEAYTQYRYMLMEMIYGGHGYARL